MYKVFLAGGIASGKSTVSRILEGLGATRIDLDQVSRKVLSPRSACAAAVAKAFGEDLVNPATGEIDRALLAKRAFATPEGGARLEAIELPFISEALARALEEEERSGTAPVCVVAPLDVRRVRAQGRGMDVGDFDRRVALQPSDEYLRSHADVVFDNTGGERDLASQVHAWWDVREREGWPQRPPREDGAHR